MNKLSVIRIWACFCEIWIGQGNEFSTFLKFQETNFLVESGFKVLNQIKVKLWSKLNIFWPNIKTNETF